MPAQVVLKVDADGQLVGRVAPATLTGNLFDVFGDDFVGVSRQTVDPFSAETFLVTHLQVNV